MFENLFGVENLIALFTLSALEIVLGIDNIIFIAILTGGLDPSIQSKARRVGLLAAMVMRILLLLSISWIMRLQTPFFTLFAGTTQELGISGKDLILILGGAFLIGKSTLEIHKKMEIHAEHESVRKVPSFGAAIVQIMLIDIVFSLDSVITAVGMAQDVRIMIAAVVVAVLVMMAFADPVARFVEKHPTFKMLALSFLLLIGVMLVADGLHQHISKGYVYFAMAFSLGVEILNLRLRRKQEGQTPAA